MAFDQQAEYINNQAEIETTNKLLESSYDLYKARLWVLDLDSKNETQQERARRILALMDESNDRLHRVLEIFDRMNR